MLFLDELQLEHVRPEPSAIQDLPAERFLERLLREVAGSDENLADAHARRRF